MGKGSTRVLIKKVIDCLRAGPMTVSEIVKETGMDRAAIGRYVNILKDGNILDEDQLGKSKKLLLVQAYRSDTYFGLPLDPEAEKKVSSLYSSIKRNWKKLSERKLLRTHVQKIAYGVITSCDELKKIPHGWYLYGGVCVLNYDDSREYHYYGFTKKTEAAIKKETEKHARNKFAWQSKLSQYEETGNELYLKKEKILAILFGPGFEKDPKSSLYVLVKEIRRLVSMAPRPKRGEYYKILDAYQDLMLDVTNKFEGRVISDHRKEITQLFEAVWKYIALFNFKDCLAGFYSRKMLDVRLMKDITHREDEIIEIGTELQSLIPEDEIADPLKKELKDALAGIKLLTPKEQKVQKAKMRKLKEKLGLKKFNDRLRKEAGLD